MNPKIISNYKWYQHPIRWLKEYNSRKVMQLLMDYEWENGMNEKVEKSINELILTGETTINGEKIIAGSFNNE